MIKRSGKLVLAGLLCLVVGAGGLWLVWQQVHAVKAVWVAARPIAAGQVIRPDDVEVASVVLSAGVVSVPGNLPVAGEVALVDIPQGAMLVPEAIADVSQTGDHALMSVVVDVGQAPVGALTVGSQITLIGPSGLPVSAVVASQPLLFDSAHHRFDVAVSLEDAPRLAQWVAGGTVIVIAP